MDIRYIVSRCVLWRFIYYVFFPLLGALAIVLIMYIKNGAGGPGRPMERASQLINVNGTMPGSPNQVQRAESREPTRTATYILGGPKDSLILKYCTAVSLYRKGLTGKLMVASFKGVTEYAQDLDRNLTNDEWTIRQLTNQGVMCEDISFIMLQNGFFGTLRESKTLKAICIEKGIKKLLLVCSAYHSKRVRIIFSAILEGTGVVIDIHAADERVGWGVLFVEYLKLILYEYILIPLERNSS